MAGNRLIYLVGLAAVTAFYFVNGTWFSWVLLLTILALPWFSLLCSLPSMLRLRLQCTAPECVEQGQQIVFRIRAQGVRMLPLPELRVRLELRQVGTGEKEQHDLQNISRRDGVLSLPAAHAGQLCCTLTRVRAYDALRLFRLRIKAPAPLTAAVLPLERMPEPMPELNSFQAAAYRPKAGGGVSENHDHREYREGDDARSIQWKLSCKSDKLIIREPLEPVQRRVVLLVQTPADARELDEVLGQLRWLSRWLRERGYAHRVCYFDGDELRECSVLPTRDGISLLKTLCALRCAATPPPLPDRKRLQADWLYILRPVQKGGDI